MFAALEGVTVATKVSFSPTVKAIDVLSRLTPDTATGLTVTAHVAFFPPSSVVTVIVAVPTSMAVTRPSEEMVATDVLLDDHCTVCSEAFVGCIMAVRALVSPFVMETVDGLIATDSTAT